MFKSIECLEYVLKWNWILKITTVRFRPKLVWLTFLWQFTRAVFSKERNNATICRLSQLIYTYYQPPVGDRLHNMKVSSVYAFPRNYFVVWKKVTIKLYKIWVLYRAVNMFAFKNHVFEIKIRQDSFFIHDVNQLITLY